MKRKQIKKRFLVFLFIYSFFAIILVHDLVTTIFEIYQSEKDKVAFKKEIEKLKEPDYIARYAREKYLYSKDGEIIIRIPD